MKSGDPATMEIEINRLKRFSDMMMHGPYFEELGLGDREAYMIVREFPRMLHRVMDRTLESQIKKRPAHSTKATDKKGS